MAQYDVYRYRGDGDDTVAFLLDIQANLLSDLATRIVIPMVDAGSMRPVARLNPVFEVDGRAVALSTQELGAFPVSELGGEIVDNLADRHVEIIGAVDFLISGF